MDPLKITLPLPSRVTHPNGRTRNHGYRAAAVRKQRGEAKFIARHALPDGWEPLTSAVVLVLFHLSRTKQDGDNLLSWLKPSFDGLTDAGVWVDYRVVTFEPVQQVRSGRWGQKVEVTVYGRP